MIALALAAALAARQPGPGDALARAEALVKHGRLSTAIELVDRIEREAGPESPAEWPVRADMIRGAVATERGDYTTAHEMYDRALAAATRAGLRRLTPEVLDRIARTFADQREWDRVLEYATRTLEADPGDVWTRAHYSYWRSMVSLELNDQESAERALREALASAVKTSDLELVGNIHRQLGVLYGRFRLDREAALREYEEALAWARRADSPHLVASILNQKANVFRYLPSRADKNEALRIYQEGLAIARANDFIGTIPVLLKNIGAIHRQLGDVDAAARALGEAVEAADAVGRGLTSWQAREELGLLYRDRDPALADRYFAECLDVLDGLNRGVLLEDVRAGALAGSMTLGNPYDEYADLLLSRDRADRAFLVSERFRARSFLKTLSQARDQLAATVPAAYVDEERALLRRISERQLALRTGDLDGDGRRTAMEAIAADESRLERLHLRLATEHAAAGQARFPHLWTVQELQQRLLGRDEAIVAFSVREAASTAWIIRAARLDVVALPARDRLDAAVRPLLAAMQNPRSDARGAARPLEAMLAPVVAAVGSSTHRLIVVPDGILSYVPFEALATQDGTLLVDRYAIGYAPSASSYAFLRTQPLASGDQVVAVGNPILRPGAPSDSRSAAIERIAFLQPLPSTGDELRSIARVFPGASRTLEQQQATEAALAGPDLARAGILHFATHGVIDEERPERSGLALTAAPPSDGILQMREIYGLKLHAALVTLSACQTALGKNVTGEGLVGMSRAFFYAGANAVMASLWNVDDASTARLMGDFYAAIRDGAAIDEAARQAKLAFMARDPRVRHPYYWAAFIVTGNATAPVHVAYTPRWRRALPVEAAGLLVCVAAYTVVSALRRTRRP